jgi:predicted metalloprotease with PDZ domain
MKKLIILLSIFLTNCASPCKGILGAKYNLNTYLVAEIFSDSPAERAGIQVGDELLYPESIPGTDGEVKTVRVIRDNKLYSYEVVLQCYKDFQKPWVLPKETKH